MKIALVARHALICAHASDPYAAEQAAHVADLGKALAARGHEVVVGGDWANGQVTAVELDRRQGVLRGAASPRGMSAYAVGR